MAESSLKDLIDWAKSVDGGMSRLEHLVDRYGMLGEELNPEEVLQKFDDIIADVKLTKALVQKDVDMLRKMSEESKAVIAMTETDDFRSIEGDLNTMLSSLFPEDTAVTVEQPVPSLDIETTPEDLYQGDDALAPLDCAENVSPIRNPHVPDESFTEVEITPGLMSKVPKSQFGTEAQYETDDTTVTSGRHAFPLYRPIRKKTLVYSPNDTNRTSHSPPSESATPHVVLQDRSNRIRGRVVANSKMSQRNEDPTESPEILERPPRPVLASMQYGVLD